MSKRWIIPALLASSIVTAHAAGDTSNVDARFATVVAETGADQSDIAHYRNYVIQMVCEPFSSLATPETALKAFKENASESFVDGALGLARPMILEVQAEIAASESAVFAGMACAVAMDEINRNLEAAHVGGS